MTFKFTATASFESSPDSISPDQLAAAISSRLRELGCSNIVTGMETEPIPAPDAISQTASAQWQQGPGGWWHETVSSASICDCGHPSAAHGSIRTICYADDCLCTSFVPRETEHPL